MNYRLLGKNVLWDCTNNRQAGGREGRYLAYSRMPEVDWQMWKVCWSWKKTKKHYFAVTGVQIRSGKNHQWMQHLKGHVDAGCLHRLKVSPHRIFINCRGEEKTALIWWRSQATPDLVIKIIIAKEDQMAIVWLQVRFPDKDTTSPMRYSGSEYIISSNHREIGEKYTHIERGTE